MRRIPGFPKYMASEEGEIINAKTRHVLKPLRNNRGYLVVDLSGKKVLAHRAVAFAYLPNPDGLPQVDHINGVKDYNHVFNLRWVSASENVKHACFLKELRLRRALLSDDALLDRAYD